ncbi:MAG: hypothetical protein HGA45_38885, partial [Chloroflexales bacterium]|nr:hypothetical protein [Chloroflexales bacterium]
LPIIQRESQALLQRQADATEILTDVHNLELSVLNEHSAVIQLVEGEASGSRERFERARKQVENLISFGAADGRMILPYEAELKSLYLALTRRHDIVLDTLAAGDHAAALRAIHEPSTDALLDRILTLGDRARAESRAALDEATVALQQSQYSTLVRAAVSTGAGVTLALLLSWLLVSQVVRPLNQLTADAERYAAGDVAGQLSSGGNATQIRRLRDAFQRLLDVNQARQERVQSTLSELEHRVAYEEQLRATVQALSVPVVPLQANTLLLPLVGHLDEQRSAELISNLLAAIQERRARAVVLDVTGLADLTEDTARLLGQAAQAARLLGCRITLVGVRSDQALALVAGDLAASGISVARDIPAVLGLPSA